MSLFPNLATTTGFQILSAFSTATKLTVPPGATYALFSVETNAVRYRSDTTAPTASIGVYLPVSTGTPGLLFQLSGGDVLNNVQFIPVTGSATINIEYYK